MKGLGKLGWLAGGFLLGTAGLSILKSKDAKKAYTQCTAAVMRGKDALMKTGTALKENCSDITQDAKDINEERAAKAEEMEVEKARAVIEEYEAAHKTKTKK